MVAEDACPGAYARTPVAWEIAHATEWWEKGQISALFPVGVPPIVVTAIDEYDLARREFNDERTKLLAEDREKEKKR